MLVDSHCHLNFPQLQGRLDEVITAAHDAGVGLMQTICTKMSEFEEIATIARKYDNIYCSVGIHPHEVQNEQVTADELEDIARSNPDVIGIGETGLDFYYEHSPRELQEEQFRIHIEASRRTGLPLIIHSRDADEEMIRVLEGEMARGVFPALLHCFSSGRKLAMKALDMGVYISCSGIITFNKAAELREIIADVPLDRLLVETDAPFLAPVPHRGKDNEPAYTRHTAMKLADIKGATYEEIADVTTRNFIRLFGRVSAQERKSKDRL